MSKRDRHLKQRLDELFSPPAESAEIQSEASAVKPQTQPLKAANSIGPEMAAPADLSYLQTAINQLPLPAYLKDREHTWVAINTSFAQHMGHTPETLLGHTDKEQADEAWQLDDRVLDAGQPEETQETISLPDGAVCTRRTRRTPLPATGQARYVMGVVEETLIASQHAEGDLRKFQQGLERSTTAIFITDRDGVITYVNPAFEKIYGFTRAEALGQTPRIIKSGLIPAEQYKHFWATLLAGQTVAGEVTNKAKDGRLVPVEGSNSPILDESGNIIGFLALHTDISARKQSEAALLARNKQLAVFNRLGQELAQLATVQQIIEHVVEAIGEVLDNRNLYVALYDDRKQEIVFPIYTMDGERRTIAGRPFGNGMTEHILRTKKTLLIPHAVQEYAASIGIANIGRPAQCYLGVPMLSGDKLLGVIAVQDYEREAAYSPSDVELLNTIAAQTATALANVRLYTAEARRALQLQTAAEISTTAGTMLDVDNLLPFVVKLIQQRFNLYYVGLFLVDDTRQNALLRAGTGEAGQLMLKRHHQLPIDDRSMIGWCIQHQVPRIALDIGEDAVHLNNPDLPDTRSELALPLVSRGQVLGAMTVQSVEAAAFSEQDVAILQTMSDQVATAIANAQLFEQASQIRQQAEARLHETQFLQRVGQAVSSSLELSSVLDIIMEALQHELGFTHNALHLVDEQAGTVSIPRASGTAAQLQGLTRPIEQLQSDIVMDILRQGQTEVIDGWDDRFDRAIYESQGHAALVRAFVPLRLRGESIGLLEVGYQRTDRPRITPDEVRLLGGLADQIAIAVGNARLFNESQQRITELAVVNEISRTLTATQDVQQLFATIHQQVGRLYDAANFYVATYDGGEEWSSDYQFEHGQLLPTTRHKLGSGFTSHILQTQQTILMRSVEDNLAFHDRQNLPMIGEMAKSWMGVPLIVGGNTIGVMAIQSYEQEGLYTEHDVTLFSTIGAQAAGAIQNARLFQEARLRAAELTALNELSQTLAAQLNVNQVLNEVWRGVSHLLDTTNFYIALYDHEREEVSFLINASESVLDKEIEVMPADQGLTGYIIRTRQPLLITEDTSQRVKELGVENVGGSSQSYLGVPLILGDQLLGVMAIQSYTKARLYNEHDQNLMTAIAGQAAIALQNARLFERTQQNTRELAALNELGQAVSQQIEIEQVLEVAHQQLQPLAPIDAFFAALYDRDSNTIVLPVIYDEGKRYTQSASPFNPNSSTGNVILTGEPILKLLTADELAAALEVTGALGNVERPSASLLYVPLKSGAQTIGVLSIQSYQINAYHQDTVQLMSNVANQVAIAIQNARLFNEISQRSTELVTLNQIITTATQTLDLHAVLDTVLKQTLEVFGFDGGLVTMYNESRQKLERIVRIGLPGRIPDDPAEGLENSLCAYVFNSKEPLVIEDFRQGAPIDVNGEIESGYYSYIGVPLEVRGRMLGTWCGFRKTAGPFNKSTLPLLQAVGHQLGFAIDNARLFQEAQRRASEQTVLFNLAQTLSAKLSVEQVLRQIYEGAAQLIDARNFYIGLYDPIRHETNFVLSIAGSEIDQSIETLPADAGITGYVIRTRRSLLINENVTAWLEEHGVTHEGESAQSYLGVPMLLGDQVLGAMAVQNYTTPNAYTEHDRDLLLVFGAQAAIAIQNARLFEETQRTAKRELTLREITSRVRSSTDPDTIARTAIRELGLALGRSTFIRLGDAEQLSGPPQAAQETPASGNGHTAGLEGGQ